MLIARIEVKLIAVLMVFAAVTAANPSAKPSRRWWPSSGAVILAGGGLKMQSADALVDRLTALAGGPDKPIVVIPTASVDVPSLPEAGHQPANVDAIRDHFLSRGAKHIAFLHTRDREVANSESFVKILRTANAVFLTGGAFRVLDDIYHGTLVQRKLRAVFERGGVLAGDSAGAPALGCFWVGWDAKKKIPIKSTEGLCLLPDVTVTPHLERFGGEERSNDVFKYISGNPATIGLNSRRTRSWCFEAAWPRWLGREAYRSLNLRKTRRRHIFEFLLENGTNLISRGDFLNALGMSKVQEC